MKKKIDFKYVQNIYLCNVYVAVLQKYNVWGFVKVIKQAQLS